MGIVIKVSGCANTGRTHDHAYDNGDVGLKDWTCPYEATPHHPYRQESEVEIPEPPKWWERILCEFGSHRLMSIDPVHMLVGCTRCHRVFYTT